MKSICYLVPYFGKLPSNFQVWLDSCSYNETINWIIITNDETDFLYPKNVKRIISDFDNIKKIIQSKFDFDVKIDKYWDLSLFKPAYGEIFSNYLEGYDFWGHCDVDLIWGDIRKFITEDILNKYEKIGFQGHSTLYKNKEIVNQRYRTIVPNKINYIDVFSGKAIYSFDENSMEDIYKFLNIEYYNVTNFAHLSKYDYSFYLKYLPKEDDYKNKRQIFMWKNGKLNRLYLTEDKKIGMDEFMYLHFFCRPIKYKVNHLEKNKIYTIYPDCFEECKLIIDSKYVNKKGKCSKIKYYIRIIYYNRKKLTMKKIIDNIKRMIIYKKTNRRG